MYEMGEWNQQVKDTALTPQHNCNWKKELKWDIPHAIEVPGKTFNDRNMQQERTTTKNKHKEGNTKAREQEEDHMTDTATEKTT